MTTQEINRKYNRFFVTFTSNGISETYQRFGPFGQLKKGVIKSLSEIINNHYGRGEHTVTIHGSIDVDQTTPEEYKVGFGPRFVATKDEELFSL